MKNYCYICHDHNPGGKFNRDIVGVCRYRGEPVCQKHSEGCIEDGHGFDPLPQKEDE